MALPVLPTIDLFTNVGTKNGTAKDALDAILAILSQHFDVSLPTINALDINGVLIPTSANVLVDVYGGLAGSNQLKTISLTVVPDGRSIKIAAANPLLPIVVIDSYNGGAGGGEIIIDPDGSIPSRTLDDVTKTLVVKRVGTFFYVTSFTGFPPKGAITTPVGANIDFNGYGASGLSLLEKDIITATYNPTVDDRGFLLDVGVSCVIIFPNPNDVSDPDPDRHWKRGQTLYFFQQGASLGFQQFDGSPPLNAFNHDIGYGPGALVASKVYQVAGTNVLAWTILGQTDSSGGGGGGTDIIRVYSFFKVPSDYTTPKDIAWHAAGSLAGFTPVASSKYVFLVNFGIKNTGSTAQNAALSRVVIAGTPDTELYHTGSDRYPVHSDRVLVGWGATYGASPPTITLRVDVKNSSATYTTTISSISFLALKLEANEDYANDAGTHSASGSTYVDCCTLSLTGLPNDEYYFKGFMEWESSAVACHADIRITVAGTGYTQYIATRNSVNPGIATMLLPLTVSGNVTVKLQIRVAAGDTGTVNSNYASIICLAKANFQKTLVDSDIAEVSYPATAFTARLSDAWVLEPNYNHLMLANCQANLDLEASSAGLKVNWAMNAGNILPDAALGTRSDQYCSNSYGGMALKRPGGATDTFKLSFASINTANAEKSADCYMIALALDKF
jgi:hypothetical protein